MSSDHNPRFDLHLFYGDAQTAAMKDSHASRLDDDRLMLLSWSAPVLAQFVMLIIMCTQRHWMYVLMLAPGLLGGALSLAVMAMRSKRARRKALREDSDTSGGQLASSVTGPPNRTSSELPRIPCIDFERLHRLDDDPLTWRGIVRRWLESSPSDCDIGMTSHAPFAVDLVHAGPHAMVAGTTGSGKSVLLISWCMALAIRYSPEALHFVFLDFKGGSTFNALEHLPHTVGNVCDLDLSHAIRALNAIEQELIRRESLVSAERVSQLSQLRHPPARLVVVIDEFHALRDRLPDYMQRLNRLASLGRSLGMHLIVCTQNPMGQVHSDMKANISLNICLRVTDQMQSHELIGTDSAADISPSMPGGAYCHDGQRVIGFRCSAVRHVEALVDAVDTAARFHGYAPQRPLFSAPLAKRVALPDLRMPVDGSRHDIPFALADNGVIVEPIALDIDHGNIAVIGAYGRGKTNLLLHCASQSYLNGVGTVRFTHKMRNVYHTSEESHNARHRRDMFASDGRRRLVWFVDDADDLLDPFRTDNAANDLRGALADPDVTVICAVEKANPLLADRCPTRIVFPTGDRANDLMAGIPGPMLDGFKPDDYTLAGRAVFIRQASACLIQCVELGDYAGPNVSF